MPFRRTLLVALAAALATAGLAAGPVLASGPTPTGGDAIAQCKAAAGSSVPQIGPRACRSLQSNLWGTGAACRTAAKTQSASAAESCSPIDGRTISEHQMQVYEAGWVHRALTLQRQLDATAPLWNEQLGHTHNTFNSSAYTIPTDGSAPAYYPTLTNQDPNQAYSITDQLRMDVRAIELDVHWVPSPFGNASTGGFWVTLCHGTGESVPGTGQAVHVGCTADRPFQSGIAELAEWLKANPHEFVLLYLENQLFDNAQAHQIAAKIIHDGLGSRVYQPHPAAGTSCATMPINVSAHDILSSGAQVLIVGNCGPAGSPWNGLVHERGPAWNEGGDPSAYSATACAADTSAHGPGSFRRLYEDSTWLAVMLSGTDTAPFSPANTRDMVRCGVNIIGMDQLTPQDPRLEALVWSWAPGEPSAGGCAFLGTDGRFHAGGCKDERRFACVDATGTFSVSTEAGRWKDGAEACQASGTRAHPLTFTVPVNGLEGARLQDAHPAGTELWLAYTSVGGTWTSGAHGHGHPDTPSGGQDHPGR